MAQYDPSDIAGMSYHLAGGTLRTVAATIADDPTDPEQVAIANQNFQTLQAQYFKTATKRASIATRSINMPVEQMSLTQLKELLDVL